MSLLEVADVTVRFGGLVANDAVALEVREGEIAGLIGPNGAGKTTLFNAISGARPPDEGTIRFDGVDITTLSPVERARAGIARTFQNLSLVGPLRGDENVSVGMGRFRRWGLASAMLRLPAARTQDARIATLSARALRFVGLDPDDARLTADLPYGERRRLEFARALALGPRLLLLDEPSAGMDPAETGELADTVRRARDELGVTVLVVEHDMSFVRTLAERTTVLDFGRVLVSGPTQEVFDDTRVAEAYLGRREADRGKEVTHG